ncbi:MAG: molecular chaperone TorD family protein [Betaproteobacteria bacterium]|nr:molecular chaperone TorD family protein [Betaproteobacteria bacterium]
MTGEDLRDAVAGELLPEDAARARFYALIGRLFYDAPDSMLLAEICRGEEEPDAGEGPVGAAWRALREVCKTAYPVVIKQEYDTLFAGVGKSEVTPYTSHYITGNSPDRHLVWLRERLHQLGLARRNAAFEVEDHVSGICDVMRILVVQSRSHDEQRLFFNEFAYPGIIPFCETVAGAASAVFYRPVARFARAFFEVEKTALGMEEF